MLVMSLSRMLLTVASSSKRVVASIVGIVALWHCPQHSSAAQMLQMWRLCHSWSTNETSKARFECRMQSQCVEQSFFLSPRHLSSSQGFRFQTGPHTFFRLKIESISSHRSLCILVNLQSCLNKRQLCATVEVYRSHPDGCCGIWAITKNACRTQEDPLRNCWRSTQS